MPNCAGKARQSPALLALLPPRCRPRQRSARATGRYRRRWLPGPGGASTAAIVVLPAPEQPAIWTALIGVHRRPAPKMAQTSYRALLTGGHPDPASSGIMDALRFARPAGPTHPFRSGTALLGIGRAEVGEFGQQVVVRLEARGGNLAVGQPGEAHAVDVVGGDAAVGVGGGLGPVVVQDVR